MQRKQVHKYKFHIINILLLIVVTLQFVQWISMQRKLCISSNCRQQGLTNY